MATKKKADAPPSEEVVKPVKKTFGNLPGAGPGRPKGLPNKSTRQLKEMILQALEDNGGVAYLAAQAKENPKAFLSLLSRILPLQVSGDPSSPLTFLITSIGGSALPVVKDD